MRPLLEELGRERQRALIAEGARLSRARAAGTQPRTGTRGRRAIARQLHSLAERVDALEVARIHSA